MGAKKYRHRITIRNAPTDASRNSFGERTGTGTTVATVWAERRARTAREYLEGKRESAALQVDYIIRYRTDIDETMKVVDADGQVYDISGPPLDRDGTMKELLLNCTARKETL